MNDSLLFSEVWAKAVVVQHGAVAVAFDTEDLNTLSVGTKQERRRVLVGVLPSGPSHGRETSEDDPVAWARGVVKWQHQSN